MVSTRRRPSAQSIKCPTAHSGHITATSHRVWCLRRMASTFPDLNPLDFSLWGYIKSNSECMQPLHQHSRNFETVLRILVPACHLPCCTMCSRKCSPVSRCVLSLKDIILSMTDR
ncbi:hypothetical protein AVEN_234619-1 [Araneus ventricosus]|uniref:Uncharacterized protein n=1 Tax=Araneus ventricosus TaxID=182803 RepID=A0A4Y2VVD9_ARAVE|nr:hypothetical protein AVEN_234619-1 [Araneus ventricosus]